PIKCHPRRRVCRARLRKSGRRKLLRGANYSRSRRSNAPDLENSVTCSVSARGGASKPTTDNVIDRTNSLMDIAHQLAALRAQPPAELLKSVNRYLPPVVTLILLAAVAYLAAQLTWRLVPTQADAAPLPPIAAPAAGGAG